MSLLIRTLLAVAVAAGVAAPAARADEKVKKPAPPAEPGKTIVIQIDASKLPPEVLKELLKLSKPTEPTKPGVKPEPTKPVIKPEPSKPSTKPEPTKPGTKPEPTKPGAKPVKSISLADAIAIAEKATQGTVVKAERKDEDGAVQFKLDVLTKGGKTKVTLDAGGNVTDTEKKGQDDEDEDKSKGKKKK